MWVNLEFLSGCLGSHPVCGVKSDSFLVYVLDMCNM